MISPDLQQALQRLKDGTHTPADLEALRRALQAGQIALAIGERAVAIGGSAEGVVIVTGEGNVVQVLQGTAAEAVQRLSTQFLDHLTKRYLDNLAEEWQFLTVSVHGEDRRLPLERVFFMLQARERPEARPTEPPFPDLDPAQPRLGDAGVSSAGKPPPPPVPLETVLGKGENLVLLGEPGAGKSTALQFIGLCFARAAENRHVERLKVQRAYIPIRLNLQTSAASIAASEALIDVLRAEVRERLQCPPAEAEALLEAWKVSPGLLVLLDGLDEVPADLRTTVRERIQTFAHSGAAWVILTSRPAGFRPLSGLHEYTLKPFENPETEALPYLRGWLAVLKPEWTAEQAETEARALLEKMQARLALRRLLDNPLLLRLSAQHYASSSEIARNRADLYRLWVEEAWKRAEKRGAAAQEKPRFLQALQALAWHLHTGGGNEEADLLQALQKFGLAQEETAAEDLLRRLREQTGLLARLPGPEDGQVCFRYVFSHQTLREYLVAQRLQVAWKQDAHRTWRFLKPRLHLPEWREPLALLACSLPEAEALRLLNWILHARSSEERFMRRDLLLTAELAAESGYAGAMWESLWPGLRRMLKDSSDWSVRQAAVWGLVKLGSPAVLDLIGALKDESMVVRWQAAEALGELGDPQAVPALQQTLRDEGIAVRREAARALVKLSTLQNIDLQEALKDKNCWIRQKAIVALVRIGSPALPILIRAIKDENEYVRWTAAWALGELRERQAVPALIEALKDEWEGVRQEAAWALGELGERQAIPTLIEAFESESMGVCWEAAQALKRLGGRQALSALIETLKDKGKEERREAAALAIWELGEQRAVTALLEALKDEGTGVYQEAVQAPGELGDWKAVSDLWAALKDSNWSVRQVAAKILESINPTIVADLICTLEDQELSHKETREILGSLITICEANPNLLESEVFDNHSGVRWMISLILGIRGVPSVISELSRAQADKSAAVRFVSKLALWATFRSVKRSKDRSLLIKALQHYERASVTRFPWQDPLQPPPASAWQVWSKRAGWGALALLLAGLLALAAALLVGVRKPLEEAARAFGQAWPLWAVALLVMVLGAAGVLLGWLLDALRKK